MIRLVSFEPYSLYDIGNMAHIALERIIFHHTIWFLCSNVICDQMFSEHSIRIYGIQPSVISSPYVTLRFI